MLKCIPRFTLTVIHYCIQSTFLLMYIRIDESILYLWLIESFHFGSDVIADIITLDSCEISHKMVRNLMVT